MADSSADEEDKRLKFSLEIERDASKEIALATKDTVPLRALPDRARSGAAAAEKPAEVEKRDSDRSKSDDRETAEEKKRRRVQGETKKDADVVEREQPQERGYRQVDRSFPHDIQRRFYIRADHRGDQHVFADSQAKREVFQESGDKLRTKINDAHAVRLMLDTVAHRGWSSIKIKGSQEFRREAWLEGQARGIAVTGYNPAELDLQELKNREQAYLRNEIVPAEHRTIRGASPQPTGLDAEDEKQSQARTSDGEPNHRVEPSAPNERARADGRMDYHEGIEGTVVEQGSRPYKDNAKNDPSPYVVLKDDRGYLHTAWGVGLPDAMLKAGARQGDHLRLREVGMESVTKNVLREIDGRTVRIQQEVERRAWDAIVLRERETGPTQGEQAEPEDQPFDDRLDREFAASRNVNGSAASAEHTLHIGPGRDAALDDGAYANKARAKEYMTTGRTTADRSPELTKAAAVEAYVERKVKQKYPNDPVVVQRAMQTARIKIGHALAHGCDFPEPCMVAVSEFNQSGPGRDQQSSQQVRIQMESGGKNREQNVEKTRNQDRS